MWAATRPQEITVAIQAAAKSLALTTIIRAATKSQAVKIMGGGHSAAADPGGGNNLVADLSALFHGGGQNSLSAVVANLSALTQAAGVHGNGVAMLTELLAGAAGQKGTPAWPGDG